MSRLLRTSFFFRKTVHAVRIENIVKGTMGIKKSGV